MTESRCALADEKLREARAAQAEAQRLQEQAGELERKWRAEVKGEDEAEGARRRARLRADGEMVEGRIRGLIRQQSELAESAKAIETDFQQLLLRYSRKQDELATTGDGPGRDEIETELADLLVQRYLYERDAKLLERANGLRAEILERKGEVLIPEEIVEVQTPEGLKRIPISKLGDYGGVGVTFCGKGSIVPKEWARRYGLI